jgi:hypothetical protein
MRRFTPEARAAMAEPSFLGEYEQHVGEWEARFRRFTEIAHGHEVLYQTTKHPTVLHIGSFQAAAVSARVVNLANGLVAIVNARNAYSAPVIARAIFETCAIPLYMRRNLLPRLKKGRTQQVHAMLWRLGLGTRLETGVHAWKLIEVDNLINAMANETDDVLGEPSAADHRLLATLDMKTFGESIRYAYSVLSEYTHPNHAAMTTGLAIRHGHCNPSSTGRPWPMRYAPPGSRFGPAARRSTR